ncbi:MAG: glycosyltransferase [Planctomycetes bacterium]|nr:glycosyltransferase [Planctomycetota bacterium]
MRTILVVCPYVPHPPNHGGSIRSRVLLEALAQDHRVHVAVPAVAPSVATTELDRLAGLAALGVEPHELPSPTSQRPSVGQKLRHWLCGSSELLARRWSPHAAAALAALRERLRPDLVVLDSTFAVPIWRGAQPVLLHLHNLEHHILQRPSGAPDRASARLSRAIEAWAIRRTERRALRRAALAVCVSAADRTLALQLAPATRVEVVPNTIDTTALPPLPPPPPGPPRLLYVGGLDYPPNRDAVRELLTDHLPVLRAALPGLTVRLVGRDPAGVLRAFAGCAGIEAMGAVGDLRPHYAESHAVYLPIRSGGGTRIKILEAWALGRPVLATRIASEGLPAEDGVHLRHFVGPTDGARALREVLAGQDRSLCAAGRQLVAAAFDHGTARRQLRALAGALVDTLPGGT